jgi:hypothetical protein
VAFARIAPGHTAHFVACFLKASHKEARSDQAQADTNRRKRAQPGVLQAARRSWQHRADGRRLSPFNFTYPKRHAHRARRFVSTPDNHSDASRVGYRTELDR